MNNRERLYTGWANLVDIGFEFSLANLKARYGQRRALAEIKTSIRRQNEAHCKDLIRMLRRLK